jgi:AP-1 complex subunit gamma-1
MTLLSACSSLITKVRRAKTAAEERAIIKKESAYLRTALSQGINKYTKRNMVKLMYMRMLGYPAEFGQVPCLALITKGDYSEKVQSLTLTPER